MNPTSFEWEYSKYERFLEERNLAIKDLLFRLKNEVESNGALKSVAKILDIGCGGGNSTAFLCQTFRESKIIGIDNSSDMLKKARSLGLENVEFIEHNANNGFKELLEQLASLTLCLQMLAFIG